MRSRFSSSRCFTGKGFTLLELLVSFAVLSILLVLLTSMISRTSSIWSYTRSQTEQFREARDAFDAITRTISEATLNTYFDYEDDQGQPRTEATRLTFVPQTYGRQSELRFLSGPGIYGDSHAIFFQTPLGRTGTLAGTGGDKLLNTLGYYIEFNDDSGFLPSFLNARKRPRLMELCEPTEDLSVYRYTTRNASAADRISQKWFTDPLGKSSPPIQIVAENIIALILLPQLPEPDRLAGNYDQTSLAPNYTYDSTSRVADPNLNPRNQLPPTILATMVAIDEASAARLGESEWSTLRAEIASRFLEADDYETDLNALKDFLNKERINYRIFSTSVVLKNAKWSREQRR